MRERINIKNNKNNNYEYNNDKKEMVKYYVIFI